MKKVVKKYYYKSKKEKEYEESLKKKTHTTKPTSEIEYVKRNVVYKYSDGSSCNVYEDVPKEQN